ncbi:MAG: hypothetical protein KatS3mg105_1317 [Gemmatales bacterium]|nr:MAG: hypothetical protein KatS3mg105_1317 [Gemmatales bacterium]
MQTSLKVSMEAPCHTAEYLVSYGKAGDFGRFLAGGNQKYARGQRVVIRTEQGLHVGNVLCPVHEGHLRFLSRTAVGQLLRPLSEKDADTLHRLEERAASIFEFARRIAAEQDLPIEIVDVELSFDEKRAIVYHLRQGGCDYREFVSTLARSFDVQIAMENLALPAELEDADAGCDDPNCGKKKGGCGSSGGCTTCGVSSTCGKSFRQEDIQAYLAGLQQSGMPERTSLL